jgi:peroxiredoxin
MKRYLIASSIAAIFCVAGAMAQTKLKVVIPPEEITASLQSVLDYNSNYLKLTQDFTGYDEHGRVITKTQLLKALTTGNYVPVKVSSGKHEEEYQLYLLKTNADDGARAMLKQIGVTYYGFDLMVGKKFPAFHYVDVNGKVYTTENTKGKIVVLKAWFISCVPCVAEMPMLNKLTEQYKNRKDIVFVSLATDPKKALQGFLKRKPFKYAVVPSKAAYIQDNLHATGYPCHWIINKQGVVVNMTYDHSEMIAALQQEAQK